MKTLAALLAIAFSLASASTPDAASSPQARSAFPLSIGIAHPGGVFRDRTDGSVIGLVMEIGYRRDVLPGLAVVDRVEGTLASSRALANRLGLAWELRDSEVSADLGLHVQDNVERLEDRCDGSWGPSATDCRASNRLVGTVRDRSIYLSLGGGIAFRLAGDRGIRLHAGVPVKVFSHDEEQDLRWIQGWDGGGPGIVPVLTNKERIRLTCSLAYQVPF